MTDFKPRPGSFTPYLEAVRREREGQQSPPASPITLLELLASQSKQALPIIDLQTRSGMEPSRYRDALKSLRDAGFVTIEGPALDEVVQLTDKGVEVSRLARPA